MQNYQLQQLLLLQQLSGGGLPILGLQGIANPLLGGTQAPAAATGLTGYGTGQTGLGTSQTSFPPGFAPPGLAQSVPPPGIVNPAVDTGVTGQAGLSGLTTPPQASASVLSVASSQQVSTTSGDDLSACAQTADSAVLPHQTPPTSVTSSTHPLEDPSHSLPSSAHPSEDTTPLPSAATNRSVRQTKSSSLSFSSLSDHSARSSLSSEGEPPQSSRKFRPAAGVANADSCVTDSSESEGGRARNSNNAGGAGGSCGGECQLFYSGGARSPAWAKEKAFIKR